MTVVYTLTVELRTKFKEPFGTLIEGTFDQTMTKLKQIVAQDKPTRLISVGDVVSNNLHDHGIHPQLTVIDNISLRDQVMPQRQAVEKTVCVKNPQGTITQQAIDAIKAAMEKKEHIHIVVEGEEDLLTLIAVLYAPLGSFVVYGQPHVGIVVVKASAETKARVETLLKAMKPSKS
jgi:uncharacterized protein (UPF0218 family)